MALIGNDFRFRLQHLQVLVGDESLEAVLTMPTGTPPRGLVVIIHGDGPIDADNDGLYFPWFEVAADAGYATLSWSKPGIAGSDGNWLDQSMEDRAAEVSAVIDWARGRASIPTERIVLWGASQAGWVLPKVAASRDDIAAVIALNPAINWLRQGRYHLLAELDHNSAGQAERDEAIRCSEQTRRLLKQKADYNTYRATTCDPEPLTEDRWRFAIRNYASDATDDLVAMGGEQVPVLLMLSTHDRHVDVSETAATYTSILGAKATVQYFDAAHTMARPAVEDSELLGLVIAVLWPRALMADNSLAAYRDYLEALP